MIEKIKSLPKYIGVYQSIGNESLTKSNLSKKLESYYGKSTVIEKTKQALDGQIPMVISKDDKVSIDYEEFRGVVEGLCKLFGTDAAVLFTGPAPAPGGRKGDNPQIAKVPNKVENPQFTECKKKNMELKNEVVALKAEKENLEKQIMKLKSEKIIAAMAEPTVRIDTARIIGKDVREDIFLHNVSDVLPGERDRSKVGGCRDSFYKKDADKSHQLTVANGRRRISEFLCKSRFFEKLFNDCNTKVDEKTVSDGGTVLGLKKDKTYTCEFYTGTYYQDYNLTANIHSFGSLERFVSYDYEFMHSNFIVIQIPEYFKSGYYFVNGVGLFRYVSDTDVKKYNGEAYDAAINWNDPIILYNEDGTVKYDPSNPDSTPSVDEVSDPGDSGDVNIDVKLPVDNTDEITDSGGENEGEESESK